VEISSRSPANTQSKPVYPCHRLIRIGDCRGSSSRFPARAPRENVYFDTSTEPGALANSSEGKIVSTTTCAVSPILYIRPLSPPPAHWSLITMNSSMLR